MDRKRRIDLLLLSSLYLAFVGNNFLHHYYEYTVAGKRLERKDLSVEQKEIW